MRLRHMGVSMEESMRVGETHWCTVIEISLNEVTAKVEIKLEKKKKSSLLFWLTQYCSIAQCHS